MMTVRFSTGTADYVFELESAGALGVAAREACLLAGLPEQPVTLEVCVDAPGCEEWETVDVPPIGIESTAAQLAIAWQAAERHLRSKRRLSGRRLERGLPAAVAIPAPRGNPGWAPVLVVGNGAASR